MYVIKVSSEALYMIGIVLVAALPFGRDLKVLTS